MKIAIQLLLIAIVLADNKTDTLDPKVFTDYGVRVDGTHYAGYLPVEDDGSAQFHYHFILNDTSKPVTLWLNGGPGCSSLQGLFNEVGPFNFIHNTSKLENNDHSWTQVTNLLFLESPINVGFSYGPGNITQSDASTASYNLRALREFFDRFEGVRNNEFYIAGESYAGVYIPTLANQINIYNAEAPQEKKINLKGIMIGNGCTDPTECLDNDNNWQPFYFEFLGGHNLISPSTFEKTQHNHQYCKAGTPKNETCFNLSTQVEIEFSSNDKININPYGVYNDCPITVSPNQTSARKFLLNADLRDSNVPPCADATGLYAFLQNTTFIQGMNVNSSSFKWDVCSSGKQGLFSYKKDERQSYYLYPALIQSKIRIWKFSGDTDAVVPITGTLYWINKLQVEYNLRNLVNWRPWFVDGTIDEQRQVAGNFWRLDGLTFVTVKGAGHMVPTDKRYEALQMFKAFVAGQDLPEQ